MPFYCLRNTYILAVDGLLLSPAKSLDLLSDLVSICLVGIQLVLLQFPTLCFSAFFLEWWVESYWCVRPDQWSYSFVFFEVSFLWNRVENRMSGFTRPFTSRPDLHTCFVHSVNYGISSNLKSSAGISSGSTASRVFDIASITLNLIGGSYFWVFVNWNLTSLLSLLSIYSSLQYCFHLSPNAFYAPAQGGGH